MWHYHNVASLILEYVARHFVLALSSARQTFKSGYILWGDQVRSGDVLNSVLHVHVYKCQEMLLVG